MFLLRYWKQIAGVVIVLALVAALWGHGYYTRGLACTAALLSLENAQLEAQRKETEYWQRKAYEADEAAAKAREATREAVRKAKERTGDREQAIERVPVTGACVRPDGLPRLDGAADEANAAAGH